MTEELSVGDVVEIHSSVKNTNRHGHTAIIRELSFTGETVVLDWDDNSAFNHIYAPLLVKVVDRRLRAVFND